MHYYQHHIGDFLRDAGSLPNEALGAYMRLLWRYYADEAPIQGEPEDIAFDLSTSAETVRQLLRRYFHKTDDGWRHTRCDREIEQYRQKAEKAAASANARWKNARAMRSHSGRTASGPLFDANQEPITKNQQQEQKTLSPDGDAPDRFAEFWKLYPRDEGKKKARDVWDRKKLNRIADTIIADVVKRKVQHGQWLDGICPHATTYLNGERWNDAITPRNNTGARNEPNRNLSAVERVRAAAIAGELADRAAARPNSDEDAVGPDGRDLRPPLDL